MRAPDSFERYRQGWCPLCDYEIKILPPPVPQIVEFSVPESDQNPDGVQHAFVLAYEYCPGGHGGPVYFDPFTGRQSVGEFQKVHPYIRR